MGNLEKRFPIYSKILQLYPANYQKQYKNEMLQTLADMLDDPDQSKETAWARAALDLPFSLVKQNLIYVGVTMRTETPDYVKRNSAIAAALLLPFFVIVFSHTLQHSHLYSSYTWQSSLYITLIFMPVLAFLLCAYTAAKWSRSQRSSLWRKITDVRRSWMVVVTGLLALSIAIFVPFHDSTQCVSGNPIKELRNWHQTWHCIADPPQGPR